jgi:uncharacterized repeat protein (TIGR01451 family)
MNNPSKQKIREEWTRAHRLQVAALVATVVGIVIAATIGILNMVGSGGSNSTHSNASDLTQWNAVVNDRAARLGWWPERRTYQYDTPPAEPVVNSIVNNPNYGDERAFTRIRDVTTNSAWSASIDLRRGDEYEVSIFYHNDSDRLPLTNVSAQVKLPTLVTSGSASFLFGHIALLDSDVQDTVSVSNHSSGDFALRYKPDSARIANNSDGVGQRLDWNALSSTGAGIGSHQQDGLLEANASGHVFFGLVADQAALTFTVQAQLAGTEGWSSDLAVHPGDTVAFLLSYANVGTVQQKDIVFKDQIPSEVKYVPGSSRLYTDTSAEGGEVVDDGINAGGINVGTYNPRAAAYLTFRVTVVSDACRTIQNTGYVETDNGWTEQYAVLQLRKAQC